MFAGVGALFFYAYFTVINPSFQDGGRAVDVGQQVIAVVAGSLGMGLVVSAVAALVLRTRGGRVAARA